jgi:hypothetical protein
MRAPRGVEVRGAATLVACAVFLVACSGDDSDANTSATTVPRAKSAVVRSPILQSYAKAGRSRQDTYRGTMAITVGYHGYDCQLRDLDLHLLGTRTYRMPVQVIRGARAGAEGLSESGPYNLIVSADPGTEAGITLVSATVVPDARDGDPILFEYWKLTGTGTRISGELVNSWRRAGIAANVFATDRLLVPCRPDLGIIPKTIQTINEGARLSGTITDGRAVLTIKGQTFDKERRFTARVVASR